MDRDEIEEERVWLLLIVGDQEEPGCEEAEDVDSERKDRDDVVGVDITFLTVPLPGLSLRLISRWKVLMLASMRSKDCGDSELIHRVG